MLRIGREIHGLCPKLTLAALANRCTTISQPQGVTTAVLCDTYLVYWLYSAKSIVHCVHIIHPWGLLTYCLCVCVCVFIQIWCSYCFSALLVLQLPGCLSTRG